MRALLLTVLMLLGGAAWAQQLALQTYRVGPSHTQGWDLLEDQRGFLWIATTGGLSRYDGTQFLHFGIADGLPNQTIRSLVEGADGTIWMGTDEGIVQFDGREFRSTIEIDQLALGSVWRAVRDRHGTLWFIDNTLGLIAVPPGSRTPHAVPVPERSGGAMALYADDQDQLWIGWRNENDGSTRCRFDASAALSDCAPVTDTEGRAITAVAFELDAEHRMVIAEKSGRLRRWNGSAAEPWLTVPSSDVSGLARRSDGTILVATDDVGAFVCEADDSDCLLLDRSNGLPDTSVNAIRNGGNGRLWFLTGVGVAQWNEQDSIRFPLPAEVGGTRGLNLDVDAQGRIWVGTMGGLARLTPHGLRTPAWRVYGTADGLPIADTWSTMWDSLGRLWIGTSEGVCVLGDDDRCAPPPGMNAILPGDVSQILQTRDGRIWVAMSEWLYGLELDAAGRVKDIKAWDAGDGLMGGTLYALAEDTVGRLWIGATAGVNVFDRGHMYRIGRAEGLPAIDTYTLAAAADGSVWSGLNGGGLVRMAWQRGEPLPQIDRYSAFDGVPDTIEKLAFAPDRQHLWLTSERNGIYEVDTAALVSGSTDAVHPIRFFGMDDLQPVFTSWPLADGRTWTLGQRDVAIVRPLQTANRSVPRARISRVDASRGEHVFAPYEYARELEVKLTAWLGAGPLEFKPNEPRIRFEFHSAQLDTSAVRYSTQLQGFESDWTPANTVPFREYTNLGPGEYQFRVRAALEGGAFGPPAAVTFRIPPAFWQTPWFILLGVVALVGAGMTAHRLRLRAVARQNQMLERQVAQRTADLESATARALIAERSKRRFLAGMTHELRTPLTALLGFARLLLDRSKNDELQRYARNIYDSGDELLNHINNMLDYARLESGQMQVHRAPTTVETVVHIAGSMMEGYAARREVSIEIEGGEPLPEIDTDATKLRQMLLNLLSNAVKFSPQANARVQVYWRRLPAEESPLQRDSIEIGVRDHGIGIAANDLVHIFDEFRQAEADTSEMPSSGLGLSIVSQFAQMLDGTITVESERGRGSCFKIVLPVGEGGS